MMWSVVIIHLDLLNFDSESVIAAGDNCWVISRMQVDLAMDNYTRNSYLSFKIIIN